MNLKSLSILFILLIVGAVGYYFTNIDQRINAADSIGSPIMPGLFETLNDVTSLSVIGAGDQVLATLQRQQDQWVLEERDNYPADLSKIRNAVLALAEARITEEKTSSESLYDKLGVEDISKADATGVKVILKHADQQQQLIVGKPGPQINKTRYVRRAGEQTSWLIDRKIDLNYEAAHWLQKDILSVEPADIALMNLTLQDGSRLEMIIQQDNEEYVFTVVNLSNPDAQVIEAEIHQITNALSSFQMLDVQDSVAFEDNESTYVIEFELKSNVRLELTAYEVDKDHYIVVKPVAISADQSAKDYVENLQKITNGRIFQIPNVTYDAMHKREADILAITEDQLN